MTSAVEVAASKVCDADGCDVVFGRDPGQTDASWALTRFCSPGCRPGRRRDDRPVDAAVLAEASAGGGAGPGVAADPDSVGPVRGGGARRRRRGSADDDLAATDPDSGRLGPDELDDAAWERHLVGGDAAVTWGIYEPAIRRWELIVGRPAPAPTEVGPNGNPRLSAEFVEFMMGVPLGHVTGVAGLSRNDQLRALGNGVVPAQAAAAISMLLDAARSELVA